MSSMVSTGRWAVATLALGLGLAGSSARAQATVFKGDTTIPVDAVIEHPVTCEPIHVVGEFRTKFKVTIDAAGGFHSTVLTKIDEVGLGLVTGTVYRITYVEPGETNASGDSSQVEFSDEGMAHFIGQGAAMDVFQHFLVHTTINANGDVTAQVDDLSFVVR